MLTHQQLILREKVSQLHRVSLMGSFRAQLYTYLFWEVYSSIEGNDGKEHWGRPLTLISLTPWTKGAFLRKIFHPHSASICSRWGFKTLELSVNYCFSKRKKISKKKKDLILNVSKKPLMYPSYL